jgi:hypothetical protein
LTSYQLSVLQYATVAAQVIGHIAGVGGVLAEY